MAQTATARRPQSADQAPATTAVGARHLPLERAADPRRGARQALLSRHHRLDLRGHVDAGRPDLLAGHAGRQAGGRPLPARRRPQFDGVPESWMSFLAVDDVDKRVAKAVKAGAKLMMPIFDVPDVGRIAMLLEPGGAGIGWMTPVCDRSGERKSHNEALLLRDAQSAQGLRRRASTWARPSSSCASISPRASTRRPELPRHQSQRQGAGLDRRRHEALGGRRHHGLSRQGGAAPTCGPRDDAPDRGDALAELERRALHASRRHARTSSTSSSRRFARRRSRTRRRSKRRPASSSSSRRC